MAILLVCISSLMIAGVIETRGGVIMYIYCNFELFDAYQTIFVIDETGKKTKIDCVDQAFFPTGNY